MLSSVLKNDRLWHIIANSLIKNSQKNSSIRHTTYSQLSLKLIAIQRLILYFACNEEFCTCFWSAQYIKISSARRQIGKLNLRVGPKT